MKNKKTYSVFGLGRYGIAVAKELVDNGYEVIAIDSDQKKVNEVSAFLPVCKCADITEPEVIAFATVPEFTISPTISIAKIVSPFTSDVPLMNV